MRSMNEVPESSNAGNPNGGIQIPCTRATEPAILSPMSDNAAASTGAPSPLPRSDRPRVFISSTIHDFRDLRSALKYWLEEWDFEVMLSEANDFAKSGDDNSYEACLKAIERCDYFVLLVGARVGGFYDTAAKVSITRMEYRRAYECLQKGTLEIFAFVRNDIWIVREDRKALEEVLQDEQLLTAESRDAVLRHKSRILNDATATFAFLDEIRRADEMKQAMATGSAFPKGNWIHPFETFSDVARALEQGLNLTGNRRKLGLKVGLTRELQVNMQTLLAKDKGKVVLEEWIALFTAKRLKIGKGLEKTTQVQVKAINTLVMGLCIAGDAQSSVQTRFLDEALRTGEFLEYDRNSHGYRPGPLQEGLIALGQAVDRFKRTPPTESARSRLMEKYLTKGLGTDLVSVTNADLVGICTFFIAYEALVQATVSAFRLLVGLSPLPEYNVHDRLLKVVDLPMRVQPTLAEVDSWMRSYEQQD
jgi:hypothetical protein